MRKKLEEYIETWQKRCYPEFPDESPPEIFDKVPSYQRVCIAILKNDRQLESLGYSREKCELYSFLKRIELDERARKVKECLSGSHGTLEINL